MYPETIYPSGPPGPSLPPDELAELAADVDGLIDGYELEVDERRQLLQLLLAFLDGGRAT